MSPGSCLTGLAVAIEPAEEQASRSAWSTCAAAFLFRRPRLRWSPQGSLWPPPIINGEPARNQPLSLEAVRELVPGRRPRTSVSAKGAR